MTDNYYKVVTTRKVFSNAVKKGKNIGWTEALGSIRLTDVTCIHLLIFLLHNIKIRFQLKQQLRTQRSLCACLGDMMRHRSLQDAGALLLRVNQRVYMYIHVYNQLATCIATNLLRSKRKKQRGRGKSQPDTSICMPLFSPASGQLTTVFF